MAPPKQQPALSKSDYATPKVFLQAVCQKLDIDSFSWDLAADKTNNVSIPGCFFDEEQDSLVQNWGLSGWLWLNPPYTNINPWVKKCAQSSWDYGAKIALLVPASVGANWFKDHCWNQAFVLYLNGRLAFIPDKPKWLYPKDLMLVIYNGWAVGSDVWTWNPK